MKGFQTTLNTIKLLEGHRQVEKASKSTNGSGIPLSTWSSCQAHQPYAHLGNHAWRELPGQKHPTFHNMTS